MGEYSNPFSFDNYDLLTRNATKLLNTGNYASLIPESNMKLLPTLSGGPFNESKYSLKEAVFHWGSNDSVGSDHTIRSVAYPLEMQLLHENKEKVENASIAVTSFLFEIIIAGTKTSLNVTKDSSEMLNFPLLLEDALSGPFFSYSGSLTFPPCSRVEHYVVFRVPLDISRKQLESFRKLKAIDGSELVNNFRPVQPLGQRYLSFTM